MGDFYLIFYSIGCFLASIFMGYEARKNGKFHFGHFFSIFLSWITVGSSIGSMIFERTKK